MKENFSANDVDSFKAGELPGQLIMKLKNGRTFIFDQDSVGEILVKNGRRLQIVGDIFWVDELTKVLNEHIWYTLDPLTFNWEKEDCDERKD
jgi:hypothetical protein